MQLNEQKIQEKLSANKWPVYESTPLKSTAANSKSNMSLLCPKSNAMLDRNMTDISIHMKITMSPPYSSSLAS